MRAFFSSGTLGFFCHLMFTTILFAEESGTISGRVVIAGGNVGLANANVIISELSIGTATDSSGGFLFKNLSAGFYQLEVSVIGYKTSNSKVEVKDGEATKVVLNMFVQPLFLEEIEIQGLLSSRLSTEKVEVITGNEISERKVQSLSELLTSIRGIDVQTAYPFGRNVNISIRGSSDYKPGGYNNRVLLLLDGFPILIPNSGAPDWNAVPLSNIQRVEILHGPSSALYGQNSMGGVINLISKSSDNNNVPSANISFGSFGTKNLGASMSMDLASYRVSGHMESFASEGHRFNSNFDLLRFSGQLSKKFNSNNQFFISTIITESETGHPGFLSSERPSLISYRFSKRLSRYFQIHDRKLLRDNRSWSNSLAVNSFITNYNDRADTPEEAIEGKSSYNDLSLSFRSELFSPVSTSMLIMIGAEGGYDVSDVSVMNPIYAGLTQKTVASFVQTRISLEGGWSVTSGIRYDYRQVDPGNEYPARYFKSFSPKLSLNYREPSHRLFHISINKGFRAPSFSELYLLHASSYGLFLQGTPSIDPESVWALETGYQFDYSKNLNLEFQFFHNRYSDMIDFVYAIPVKARNWQRVTASGAEIQINSKLSEFFQVRSDYSYLLMDNLGGSEPLLYRPKHKINTTFSVLWKKNSASLSSRYVSRQKYEDFLSHYYEVDGDLVRFPILWLPTRHLLDANLYIGFQNFGLSLKLKNITDLDYELIQNYPMPGRSWMITLSLEQ